MTQPADQYRAQHHLRIARSSEQEERFAEIVRAHRQELIVFAVRLTNGDAARAEDVVQETLSRAWRFIDRLTPEKGSVSAWLHRVTYNVAIDGHRKRMARPTEVELKHHDTPTGPDGTDEMDRVLSRMVVQDMLSSIWPEHRAVLEEIYLKDRTAAETAASLGIPVGTVKSRQFYALRALRAQANAQVDGRGQRQSRLRAS